MNKEKFDEILNKNIKELKEVPFSVEDKIQKAYQKLNESEGKIMKFNFVKIISIAACFATAIFLVGNGIAYATGNKNIYTNIHNWLLEKIGIQEEYEEIAEEVKLTQESNGIKITIEDVGYDENFLILNYRITSEDLYNKMLPYKNQLQIAQEYYKRESLRNFSLGKIIRVNKADNSTIVFDHSYRDLGADIYDLPTIIQNLLGEAKVGEMNKNNVYTLCEFVTENEIAYCEIMDISDDNFGEKVDLDIYISSGRTGQECEENIFLGEWKFTIENIKKGGLEFAKYENEFAKASFEVEKEYNWKYDSDNSTKIVDYNSPMIVVDNKNNIGQIVIDGVKISKIGSLLHISTNYYYNQYTEKDSGPYYAIDIVDKDGNVIMEKALAKDNTIHLGKKLNLNEEYTMIVYKDDWWIDCTRQEEYKKITTVNFKIY